MYLIYDREWQLAVVQYVIDLNENINSSRDRKSLKLYRTKIVNDVAAFNYRERKYKQLQLAFENKGQSVLK